MCLPCIVPGIDYNHGESVARRVPVPCRVRAQLAGTITIDGVLACIRPSWKYRHRGPLCKAAARIDCPSHATCWCEQTRASDLNALQIKHTQSHRIHLPGVQKSFVQVISSQFQTASQPAEHRYICYFLPTITNKIVYRVIKQPRIFARYQMLGSRIAREFLI